MSEQKHKLIIHIDKIREVELYEDKIIFCEQSFDADYTGSHYMIELSLDEFRKLVSMVEKFYS